MQGYKLQQAKLNLFADKRLCQRDSSKCLSCFVYVIVDTTEPNVLLYTEVGVSSCLLIFYKSIGNNVVTLTSVLETVCVCAFDFDTRENYFENGL